MSASIELAPLIDIAVAAGAAIMAVYDAAAPELAITAKQDGSPLTLADRRAHEVIVTRLGQLDASIPVLSEESAAAVLAARHNWSRFWLVDPLDGTREFIKRNGEFTVNIALIEKNATRLGVVYTPLTQQVYAGRVGDAAFKQQVGAPRQRIQTRRFEPRTAVMVISRSHADAATLAFRDRLQQQAPQLQTIGLGSSLKICLVAEGAADIYPRLAPTSEWDTAAANAVLLAAGGRLCDLHGADLRYNKPNILNPSFLAIGDSTFDWLELSADIVA